MSISSYPSRLLENAVNEFASLPGIGRKTAFRLVMNLLKKDPAEVKKFGETIIRLHGEIHYCKNCHGISDSETCSICSDDKRDSTTICVVENIQDVMAIENTRQFRGLYPVLGGCISPVEGDTTNFYIFRRLSNYNILLTTLARGVAIGDELEYTDEITLGRAINNRNPYHQ